MADNQDQNNGGVQGMKQSLQNRLQSNKQLVLKLHSILTWEQDYYPIVIAAATSFLFLIVYLLDRSVLTTLSFIGIAATILDYSLPLITKSFLSTNKWTDKDTQKFEKICLDLAKSYQYIRFAFDFMQDLKAKKPKVYYASMSSLFLTLAWIGGQFNNLFLTYLLVLLIVFYPGLEKKNVPQKIFESVASKLGKRPTTPSAGGDRRSSGGRK